jgi:uncharacterized repeat protein (TIGR01451 family)
MKSFHIPNYYLGDKKMKRMLLKIFSLVLLVSMTITPAIAQTTEEDPPIFEPVNETGFVELQQKGDTQKTERYIVLLDGKSLVTYKGGVEGFKATSPAVTNQKIDVESQDSVKYLNYLQEKQEALINAAETRFGRQLSIDFRYDVILNGFAAKMTGAEAQKLAGMEGVRAVLKDELWQPETDVSPGFIGADQLWTDTESTPGELSTKGEGMLVGVIDTGINMDHPSFADVGGDGYDHENPYGVGNYVGLCASDPTNYVCNDKLVGVYGYTASDEDVTGEDAEDHGSHTASTAAGNYLELEYNGVPVTISGIAPHANIIAYDVCYSDGCPNAYSTAAVQQAVIDGVDVLNYSIGPSSGAVNPYENAVEIAMLEAIDAGILTSTSAGNEGPEASTVYKAPAWNLIVANSTHGRIFGYPVDVHEPSGEALYEAVALPGVGVPFTSDVVDMPIRWSGDDDNVEGCSTFTADFFDGAVALISRGICTFADKINNAADAGAEAVLIYNNLAGPPIIMGGIEATTLPSAMLDKEDGDAIVALLTETLQTTIDSDQVSDVKDSWADILSSGSSRGPFELLDVLVPEVSAPGTNVLAAYSTPGTQPPYGGVGTDAEIDLMSGTSMASPHGAGAALLLMDLFPDWTPMEIKSAIVMSAYDETTVKDDGVTPTDPFDDGNGRIDLTKAALVGLVMDETVTNFTDADPSAGGDVKTLNIPSYQNSQCVGECSFSRTVRSVANVSADYTVVVDAPEGVVITPTPAAFTLAPGATQTIDFDINVEDAEIGAWQFATIELATEDSHSGATSILEENFEAWPPEDWTIDATAESCDTWLSTATTGETNNTGGAGDAADANSDYCGDAMDTWMISPAMDLTGFDSVSLSFKSDFNDYGSADDGYVDVSIDGGTTWTNVFHYEKADFRGPRTEQVDLTDFIGESSVLLRFHYTAPGWDWWWQVDDVSVSGTTSDSAGSPITNARFPLAILPDAGNMPNLVEKEVYRDAGGVVLEDLYSIEITEMTVETAGLTEANLYAFDLPGDPTNGDPFDNLDDVWYTTFTIPEGTKRLVLELLETSASDLDLFYGFGPTPSQDTLWDSAATPAALEYISWTDPIAYDWWVLVQNWGGDTEVADDITLALGLVPDTTSTNFEVSGPTSVPALTEFDLEVTWDIPEMEPLSAWYGWFSLGSDAENPGNIGQTDLNVYRPYDDVTKEVSSDHAVIGDTLTYTITVAPNETDADLDYVVHDVLPIGVTYVEGSLQTVGSSTPAVYDPIEDAIHWEGTMPKIEYTYLVSDNTTDPNCDTPFGGYVNLEDFGIYTQSGISGDSFVYGASMMAGTDFYGKPTTTMGVFTDDGYVLMSTENLAFSYINQDIPDPTLPNGLIAGWWRDMWVTYDAALNKGVSLATFGSGWLIEFDDSEDYWDSNVTLDYEIIAYYEAISSDGYPDIMVAFDNVVGDWGMEGSVGVEDYAGILGTSYAYNDFNPQDDLVVCFDYTQAGADPVVITFDVTVDNYLAWEWIVENTVIHEANGFGMVEEQASAEFMVNDMPVVHDQALSTPEETPLDITLTADDIYPGTLTWDVTDPAHGTLSGTAPDLTYTPDPDYYGSDSFTFTVSDGFLVSEVGTITIEVTNINDQPMAVDDYYETDHDVLLEVPAPGVLENDFDADTTDEIYVDLDEEHLPEHGTLEFNTDGSFTYMPDPGFFGMDSFGYLMMGIPAPERQQELVDMATVTIKVNPEAIIYLPLMLK